MFPSGGLAGQQYTVGKDIGTIHLPMADGGDGSVTYSLAPSLPTGLVFDPQAVTLTGVPTQVTPATRYTLTAQDMAGRTVELVFGIEVVDAPELMARRNAQSEVVASAVSAGVSSAISNIGIRFSAPSTGGTSVSVGGRSFTPTGNSAERNWNMDQVTAADTASFDDMSSRSTPWLGSTPSRNFEIALGLDESKAGPNAQFTIWGRADFQSFEDDRTPGPDASSYDGEATTGYAGADYSTGRVLAGAAVSSIASEADYAFEGGTGSMEIDLINFYPYLRIAVTPRTEAWAIAGYGEGNIEDLSDGARSETDLTVWMGSAGLRHSMFPAGETLGLDVFADASYATIETEDGTYTISGISADVSRSRVGTEASYVIGHDTDTSVVAYLEVAARHDNNESLSGWGVELSPSVQISDASSRFSLEARARALAYHSVDSYSESGVSITASLSPLADGTGLSLAVSPQWGASARSASDILTNDPLTETMDASGEPQLSLNSRLAYGFRYGDAVVAPFWGVSLSESAGNRNRIGTRYLIGPAAGLEIAGSHRDLGADAAEYAVTLGGRLRF